MNNVKLIVTILILGGGIIWVFSFLTGGFFPGLAGRFVGFVNSLAYIALFTAAISRAIQFFNDLLFILLRKFFHPSST